MPFKSAQATCPSRPTGLADGLELESTPTRIGESAPRHPAIRMQWFPRSRAIGTVLGYTGTNIYSHSPFYQGWYLKAVCSET